MIAKTADDLDTLKAHIRKHLTMLEELRIEMRAAIEHDIPMIGRTPRAALLVAGLLENYYTCSETIFVRISRFFENNIPAEHWHKELLSRMSLEYSGIRPKVISNQTEIHLSELMRFRHFRRYYFGTAYDWARIDELVARLNIVHPVLILEIADFIYWLNSLET